MTRGAVRPVTAEAAVQRALSMILVVPVPPDGSPSDAGHRPIAYRLDDQNGGKDPYAPHCADWSFGGRTPTSDCIGFVLWASGLDRLQPAFSGTRGPWLNCASLLDDADGARVWCEPVSDNDSKAGDWLLTREHIGIIVRPRLHLVDRSEISDHLVIDCSPRHGRATAINTGYPWSSSCRVVRYRHYQSPPVTKGDTKKAA